MKKKNTSVGILSLVILGVVAYFAAKSLDSLRELDMSDAFDIEWED